MNNILVVNVNWLGDVVFSSAVFKALKDNYPHARIACMSVPRVKEEVQCIPYVDEIILFDEKGKHFYPWGKLGLILYLRKRRFDAAFLLHGSLTRALLIYLAGIPVRVGYDKKKRGRYLTHPVPSPRVEMHRSDYYLNVIESFGVKVKDRSTALSIDVEADQIIDALLSKENIRQDDFLLILHQGGNWDLKRWPKENFKLLLNNLVKYPENKIVFTGKAEDTDSIRQIISSSESNALDLSGRLSIKGLIALMKRADCVISADSGPLHIADSLGTPVIGLFGPTKEKITGPRGYGRKIILNKDVGCNRNPCYFLECPDNVCMQAITVDEVLSAVQGMK